MHKEFCYIRTLRQETARCIWTLLVVLDLKASRRESNGKECGTLWTKLSLSLSRLAENQRVSWARWVVVVMMVACPTKTCKWA